MLKITNLQAKLSDGDKQILRGVNLVLNPGEVHVLQGANGSGKSTLAAVLSGHPDFEITAGKITLEQESYPDYLLSRIQPDAKSGKKLSVDELAAYQRALAGIFVAQQYPLSIPGVNLLNFLRLSYNNRLESDIPVFKFRKLVKEKAALINYPAHLLERNLNEGFSGGEKKKTEILQLAVLGAKYAILDETDSGLDKQAIADVFAGVQQLRIQDPELTLLVITHYEKVFDYLKPDFVHEMEDGKIV